MKQQDNPINMPRLYCDAPIDLGQPHALADESAHHIHNVLRLKQGDRLRLFNADDGEYIALISQLEQSGKGKRASLAIMVTPESQLRGPEDAPAHDLWLGFAPIKKARLEWLIEKATELGVNQFFMVETDLTNAPAISAARGGMARLDMIAHNATRQAERLKPPLFHDQNFTLSDFVIHCQNHKMPLAYGAEIGKAHDMVSLCKNHPEAGQKMAFLIGPEGGFSKDEHEFLQAAEVKNSSGPDHYGPFALGLGGTILRSETAAIAAIAGWVQASGAAVNRPFWRI